MEFSESYVRQMSDARDKLEDKVKALELQNNELCRTSERQQEVINDLLGEERELKRLISELQARYDKYANHTRDCAVWDDPETNGCSCGFVLKRVEPVQYCLCQPPTTATIKKHQEGCHLYGS